MLNKVVSSVGTLSLVGAPAACANSANVAQPREEKLVDFILSVINGETDADKDRLYNRLVEILPFEEKVSFDIMGYLRKVLDMVPVPAVLDSEAKDRLKKMWRAISKLNLERLEELDKNAESVAKAKSMYKFEKSRMDAFVDGKTSELARCFKENLTAGDAKNV